MRNFLFWLFFISIWAICTSYGIIGFVLGWLPAAIISGMITLRCG